MKARTLTGYLSQIEQDNARKATLLDRLLEELGSHFDDDGNLQRDPTLYQAYIRTAKHIAKVEKRG